MLPYRRLRKSRQEAASLGILVHLIAPFVEEHAIETGAIGRNGRAVAKFTSRASRSLDPERAQLEPDHAPATHSNGCRPDCRYRSEAVKGCHALRTTGAGQRSQGGARVVAYRKQTG